MPVGAVTTPEELELLELDEEDELLVLDEEVLPVLEELLVFDVELLDVELEELELDDEELLLVLEELLELEELGLLPSGEFSESALQAPSTTQSKIELSLHIPLLVWVMLVIPLILWFAEDAKPSLGLLLGATSNYRH